MPDLKLLDASSRVALAAIGAAEGDRLRVASGALRRYRAERLQQG